MTLGSYPHSTTYIVTLNKLSTLCMSQFYQLLHCYNYQIAMKIIYNNACTVLSTLPAKSNNSRN